MICSLQYNFDSSFFLEHEMSRRRRSDTGNQNQQQRSQKKSKFCDLNVGDRLSETQHYTIIKKTEKAVTLKNERGFEYDATTSVVEEGMYSATQYDKQERVSRTQLIEILENSGGTVFQVNFNKKATYSTVSEKLAEANVRDLGDPSALRQLSENLLLGEERTLTGYLVHTEPKLGRSQVVDLEVPTGQHNLRLVDHRTINWLILKNVRYIVN